MIARLIGILTDKEPSRIIVETGGVGFEVLISSRTYEKLPSLKASVSLNIHTFIREDEIRLIGFDSLSEKDMFLKLINVSGISVRIALSSLSIYSVEELKTIILKKEVELVKRIPGIGRKLAERMILELKDKFEESAIVQIHEGREIDKNISEAVQALKTLGYNSSEINEVLKKIKIDELAGRSTEEILKLALKKI
ncbi:MAG: Holliday junction branch migration protein RuvA [Actinobacteria bacterium]|nr:Holliday junction branch migration protein RuvA [Actinomycetota bacterium]